MCAGLKHNKTMTLDEAIALARKLSSNMEPEELAWKGQGREWFVWEAKL